MLTNRTNALAGRQHSVERIANRPIDRIDELFPWNVKPLLPSATREPLRQQTRAAGLLCRWLFEVGTPHEDDTLFLPIVLKLSLFTSGFSVCFGFHRARAALGPCLFAR